MKASKIEAKQEADRRNRSIEEDEKRENETRMKQTQMIAAAIAAKQDQNGQLGEGRKIANHTLQGKKSGWISRLT